MSNANVTKKSAERRRVLPKLEEAARREQAQRDNKAARRSGHSGLPSLRNSKELIKEAGL